MRKRMKDLFGWIQNGQEQSCTDPLYPITPPQPLKLPLMAAIQGVLLRSINLLQWVIVARSP